MSLSFVPQAAGALQSSAVVSPATQSITLTGTGLLTQTITFAPISTQIVGTPLVLSASASSGLGVSYTATPAGVCSVSGGTANFLAAGTCTITAAQSGNGSYAAATSVSQSFNVLATQSITFGAIGTQVVGTPLILSASASSGLGVSYTATPASVCSVTNGTASFVAAGTCAITAAQSGNAGFAAAVAVTQTFNVVATQTITFAPIPAQIVGTPLVLSASASSGLGVSYTATPASVCAVTNGTASFVAAGTCAITAAQSGSGSFAAATVVQSFTVLALQTIAFANPGTQTVNGNLTLPAAASSGLPVSYTSSTPAVCTVAGDAVSLLAAGTCTLAAAQAGDGVNYTAAPSVTQSFRVNTATLQVSLATASSALNVGPVNVCAAGQTTPAPCSQTVSLTYNLSDNGTIGATNVLTAGAANQDFTLASGSTCTGSVTGGATCTVNVTFTPQYAGLRSGAVQILDGSGNLLATTYVQGMGVGAQLAFGPGVPAAVGSGLSGLGVAVDGAGNVYAANSAAGQVVEQPAAGGSPLVVASGLNNPQGVALDGAGNVYIADAGNSRVVEVAAGGGTPVALPLSGLVSPWGIAVDGSGDIFVADEGGNQVVEWPASGAGQITLPFSGLNGPWGVAVDAAGDVFVADTGNNRIVEWPAGGAGQLVIGSGLPGASGVAVDAAGDVFVATQGQAVELPAGGGAPLTVFQSTALNASSLALSAAGDVFVIGQNASAATPPLLKVPRSPAPALSFAATAVGATSSDSPQAVTLQNIGNAAFTASGLTVGVNFAQTAGSGTPADCNGSMSLAPGAACNLSLSFVPQAAGALQSSAVVSPATQSITLTGTGLLTQTITFAPIGTQIVGTPLVLSASASSGLGVSYTATPAGVCSVSGGTANFLAAGTCTITAAQSGNGSYAAATSVSQSFNVLATQSITFGAIGTQVVGTPLILSASASSGLSVSYAATPASVCSVTNGTASFVAAGTCAITAAQSGNAGFAAATAVTQSFTVTVPQTITFATPAAQTVGTPLGLAATATSGLPVSFSASPTAVCNVQLNTANGIYTAVFSAIGSCILTASQAGNGVYAPASVSQTFTVNGEAQTISTTPIGTQAEGATLLLGNYFAASSGLALSFSASGDCTVSGNSVTLGASAGSCTITASQAGDGQTYAAASNMQQTIAVQAMASAGSSQTMANNTTCSTGGVAYDSAGNAYIAYGGTGCGYVNEVPASGGAPQTIISGLTSPAGVAVDSAGDVFVADAAANAVIELPAGGAQTTIISAGLTDPTFLTVNPAGTILFITEPAFGIVVEASVSQTASMSSPQAPRLLHVAAVKRFVASWSNLFNLITGLSNPGQFGLDGAGNGYVVNSAGSPNSAVLKLVGAALQTAGTTAVNLTTLASVPNLGGGLASTATAIVVNQISNGGSVVLAIPQSGSTAITTTIATTSASSTFLAVAQNAGGTSTLTSSTTAVVQTTPAAAVNFGSVSFAQAQSATVTFNLASSEILAAGTPVMVAGPDFSSTASTCTAGLSQAASCSVTVAFKPQAAGVRKGALLISDSNGNVSTTYIYGVGVGPQIAFGTGKQSSVALTTPQGVAADGSGNVYITDAGANQVYQVPAGSGTAVALSASGLNGPQGVAVDGAGNVFVADSGNNRIVELPAAGGTQSTLSVPGLNAPQGLAVDGAGNLYIANTAGNNVLEVPAGGGAAITLNTGGWTLASPSGVTVDGAGDVFIADSGNARVVEVPANGGAPLALGSGLGTVPGVAVDAAGDVFVSDAANNRIVEVQAGTGVQTLVASGLNAPYGLAISGAGDLFVANSGAGSMTEIQRSQGPALSFAATPIGQTSSDSPQTVALVNGGNAALTLGTVTMGTDFAQATGSAGDCSASVTITPGASCNVRLNFTPTVAGALSETAVLSGNALNGSATIQLSGTGQDDSQTITFGTIGTQTVGTPLALTATASSELTVSFASTTMGVCTVSGTTATFLISGTCTITASQMGNARYAAAIPVVQSFTVNPEAQSILFGAIAAQTAGTTLALNATASSGLAVSYTATPSTVCTVTLGGASLLTSGTCTITASQAGNGIYAAANSVMQSFMVNPAAQTITFGTIAAQTAGATLALNATATSGLAVSYAAAPSAVCTVTQTGVSLLTSGTCTITASQSGNATYAAANAVTQSFTVNPASQTITFGAIAAQTAGTPLTLSATATSGLPVTFASSTSSVCTVAGATVTFPAAGTCTITAAQAGNTTYAPASATQSFTVNLKTQTITFGTIAAQTATTTLTLNATASSALAVTFASSTSGVCTVSGTKATFLTAGTCTITASQAGSAIYAAASATQSFAVNLKTQTITFGTIAAQTAGGTLALTATASSGLAVTYTSSASVCTVAGSTVTLLTAGTCTITAAQAGNATYAAAASVLQSFTVNLKTQTITFGTIAAQTAGGTLALTATASSGLAVAYTSLTTGVCTVSGSTATLVTGGTCTITAAQAGNTTYAAAASVPQSFTVNLKTQTITFGTIAAQTAGGTLALTATASSGLAVTYTSSTVSVCTVSGSTATFVAGGTCTITAAQAGNATYAAAALSRTFTVNLKTQTITFGTIAAQTAGTTLMLSGAASSGLAIGYTSTTPAVCTVSGSVASFLIGGTCGITAAQAGNSIYAAATAVSQSFTVNKAAQTITFATPSTQFVGTPLALSATASSGLPVTFSTSTASVCSVSGSTATFISSGGCIIIAAQAGNSSIAAAPSVSRAFSVFRRQTITFNPIGTQATGATLTLAATASSALTVTYSASPSTVCSVSGSKASFLAAGTCTITAAQAGNSTYAAASVSQNVTVLLAQTITFGTIATQIIGTPLSLSATASSGLPVSFTSATTAICTVSASSVTFIAGNSTCSIVAAQAGNATYAAAASVTESFSVSAGLATLVSLSPNIGSGSPQAFAAVVADPNGAADLNAVYLLFNSSTSPAAACYVLYTPSSNQLILKNDAGTANSAPLTPGLAGQVSNSQCALSGTGSSYATNGNNATLTVSLSFSGTAATNAYMYASGKLGGTVGWLQEGNWGVSNVAPTIGSLSPNSGSGTSQTFSATVSDVNGTGDLNGISILINTKAISSNGCYVSYNPAANQLFLENDGGTGTSVAVTPGSSAAVSNSHCTLSGTGSSYSTSGNSATLKVALTLNENASQLIYILAADKNGLNSGWVQKGTWSVSAGTSSVVSAANANP